MIKYFFTLLLLLPLCMFSQAIKERKFDKFDSTLTISTSDEKIGHNLKAFVWKTIYKKQNSRIKQSVELGLLFFVDVTTTINEKTKVYFEFTDSTTKHYQLYSRSPKIYVKDQLAIILFEVKDNDELYTKDIKTIRISHNVNQDYSIKKKNAADIKKLLELTSQQLSN